MEIKIFIVSLLTIFSVNLQSQQLNYKPWNDSTYGPIVTFPANAVADDFGPRDLGDDWHGGVDFKKFLRLTIDSCN